MKREPLNPFYLVLLLASIAFTVTALAYAFPLDRLPEWFQVHGWRLLLVEVAVIVVSGLASMALDRWRQMRAHPEPRKGADATEPLNTSDKGGGGDVSIEAGNGDAGGGDGGGDGGSNGGGD